MQTKYLDLLNQRCPMSLLLVKRACKSMASSDKLIVKLADSQSQQDILKFLHSKQYQIYCTQGADCSSITITKQDHIDA
ncbi:sulfurtransferase TusA family protein [Vibrio gelatinilyticus]|uniref:sulfurtransferase TusA family protein n=1 Tax=Vibrio gelatinilyticus TaxID=2893468 RepID=UPI003CC5ED8D